MGFDFLHGSTSQHRTEWIHCWLWVVVSGSPQASDLWGVLSEEGANLDPVKFLRTRKGSEVQMKFRLSTGISLTGILLGHGFRYANVCY